MENQYFNYYLLSYFDSKKIVKSSQILHTLRGKKTPSMYYLVEKNQWHHGFSLEKGIKESDLISIIRLALRKKILIEKDKGFLLTSKGEKYLSDFFKNHYYPKRVKQFKNIEIYKVLWEQLQLFTQVFSEYSYQNNNYTPIIKNPLAQEKVKKFFKLANKNLGFSLLEWMKEQKFIFNYLEKEKANVLTNFLTGHKQIGKTRKQLANQLKMLDYEFKFYLRDLIEEVIEVIKIHSRNLPLLISILDQINKDYFFSMSKSTYETYEMLYKGESIQKISSYRNIKESTVKEHILEIAFILEEFPIRKYIPEMIYVSLHNNFSNRSDYLFKEAQLKIEGLEFYHYRLFELERMRMDWKN